MSPESVERCAEAQVLDSLFVVLNEDVCLEDDVFEFFVRGKVISIRDENVEANSFVFIPEDIPLSEKGIFLARSIVTIDEDFIPVKVIKADNSKIILKRGTKVGRLEKLNSEDGYFEDVKLIMNETKGMDKFLIDDLNLKDLARDEREKLLKVLKEFSDVFSTSQMDIGCTNVLQHRIDTGDTAPVATSPRRVPLALEEKVDKLVEDLLANDIIRPSESPWNAPIVIVAKKNGDIRLCVDYRRLNAVTKRVVYPIPATQQLLDCLSGSQFFTTLDLSQGYHQIPVAEEDIPKTAFATRKGQFEYKRMPFGLSTAPATFQRLMHIVLKNENWEKCLIYLDDILIFGRSVEEHLERVKAVLQRIREAGLKLSPSKCFFLRKEVDYLGHIVTSDGIRTDPKKIEKVKGWSTPTTIKQLRSFLGFCGYYRRFIKHYAEIVRPLEALCTEDPLVTGVTKKRLQDITNRWTEAQENSFNALKLALTSAPILAYPTEKDQFILDTDASDTGIGAVLSQVQDGEERVIAYASRRLTKSEKRYCVTRKELLAVHTFVKNFRHYLFGRRFLVRTDHKALLWMLNWRKPNTSQYCLWKAELEMYDMDIIHRAGKLHANADALSRLPNCQQCDLKHENPVTRRYVKVFGSSLSDENSGMESEENHLVMRVTTESLPQPDWIIKNDPELGIIVALMRAEKITQTTVPHAVATGNRNIKELWKQRDKLRIRGDVLYFVQGEHYRLVVPLNERRELVKRIHLSVGHAGIDKVAYVARADYYWPGMDEDINVLIRQCLQCQQTKNKPPFDKAPFQPTLVGEPFERVAMDISGPFHVSKHGHRYILAIIDYFSKFPVLIPLKRTDAETIARKFFKHWIALFGAPIIIHTDRGTNFESDLLKELCLLMGIKKTRTSPYYPQADGLVERLFRTIKPLISATVLSSHIPWCEAITIVEMGLRSSVQATTGFSPFEVIFGKRMKLPLCWQYPSNGSTENIKHSSRYILDLQDALQGIHLEVAKHMRVAIQRQEDHYNHNRRNNPIHVGDKVLVKVEGHIPGEFPRIKYSGPYEVMNRNNFWSYKLKNLQNGKEIDRNYNQLKLLRESHLKKQPESMRETSVETTSNLPKRNQDFLPEAAPTNINCPFQPVPNSVTPHRRYPTRQRDAPVRLGKFFS